MPQSHFPHIYKVLHGRVYVPIPHTHIEVVECPGELPRPRVLAQAGVLGADALCGVGDSRDGLLQLLVDELSVGLVGGYVRVLQAGAGRRVQQGNVPLQHAACRRHLLLVLHVLQLLHNMDTWVNVTRLDFKQAS